MRFFFLILCILLCSCNREIVASFSVKLDGSRQTFEIDSGLATNKIFLEKEPYLNIDKGEWNPKGYWGPYELALCLIEDYSTAYAKYSYTKVNTILETKDSVVVKRTINLVQPSVHKVDGMTCFYVGGGKIDYGFNLKQAMKLTFQVKEFGNATEYVGDAVLVISAGE